MVPRGVKPGERRALKVIAAWGQLMRRLAIITPGFKGGRAEHVARTRIAVAASQGVSVVLFATHSAGEVPPAGLAKCVDLPVPACILRIGGTRPRWPTRGLMGAPRRRQARASRVDRSVAAARWGRFHFRRCQMTRSET